MIPKESKSGPKSRPHPSLDHLVAVLPRLFDADFLLPDPAARKGTHRPFTRVFFSAAPTSSALWVRHGRKIKNQNNSFFPERFSFGSFVVEISDWFQIGKSGTDFKVRRGRPDLMIQFTANCLSCRIPPPPTYIRPGTVTGSPFPFSLSPLAALLSPQNPSERAREVPREKRTRIRRKKFISHQIRSVSIARFVENPLSFPPSSYGIDPRLTSARSDLTF